MKTQEIAQTEKAQTLKGFFDNENIKKKFELMLGKKSQGFITSVLQIVASNDMLSKADPTSVFNAAATAATLDLPLNNSLGLAYIVPYNQKMKDGTFKNVAQFQIGYKGFIQLAQRSGQIKTISASPIYEGQLIESNPLTGYKFDFNIKKSDLIIGFAGYFQLINGFEKTLYMTIEEMKNHGMKFSKTYSKSFSLWNTDLIGMGNKTVIKLLLSKYAPLSIQMETAIRTDQALINNDDASNVSYIDNEPENKEEERIKLMVSDAETVEEVLMIQEQAPDANADLFSEKINQLKTKSNV